MTSATRTARGPRPRSPVAAASVGAHLVGGLGLVIANRDRVAKQSGVGANTAVRTALTVAAMASTAYSGVFGARLAQEPEQPSAGGAVPDSRTGQQRPDQTIAGRARSVLGGLRAKVA